METFKQYETKVITKILVGNKIDMTNNRMISYEQGINLSKKYDIPYIETSAKVGINVEEAFIFISNEM